MYQFVLVSLAVLSKRSKSSSANGTLGFATFPFHYYWWDNRQDAGKTVGEMTLAVLPLCFLTCPSRAERVVEYLTHILEIQCFHAIFLSKTLIVFTHSKT